MNHRDLILGIIVLSQFCCTSVWFASNGIMEELISYFNLPKGSLGHLTSAVQLGFISGTLAFAVLTISDRFSPTGVFLVCALAAAFFNGLMILDANTISTLFAERFLTGFSLAGIYPVGMKIASDHFEKGLGVSLGYLVGALVVGTAFPHAIRSFSFTPDWQTTLYIISGIAVIGGLSMQIFVPNGPYRRPALKFDLSTFWKVFRVKPFRAAAFGYFGHMWELYAFWTFVPAFLYGYQTYHDLLDINISLWSFLIISIGGISCVIGGYISKTIGEKKVALIALGASGFCCIVSPIVFLLGNPEVFISFLIFWGMVVIADSPMFSTLVARNSEPEVRGSALTIVNCIGFAITIISIQTLNYLLPVLSTTYLFLILSIGPVIGLIYFLLNYKLYEKGGDLI